MKKIEMKKTQDHTRKKGNCHQDNVYGNVNDPKMSRSIEMDDTSATKDNSIEDDVYVNVEELNKGAKLTESVEKNEAPTTKKVSTGKITKTRTILAALILLIILFLILIAITSFLLKYYSDFQNNAIKNQGNLKTNVEDLNTTMVKLQDILMAETRKINKTLERICTLCPVGWKKIGSSCYFVSGEETSWDLARDECYKMNSILVMVKDKTESDSLKKLFSENRRYWIGLRRDPKDVDTLRWLDGTKVTYSNWVANEPNNYAGHEHCGETISGPWNDRQCSDKLLYICKRIKTC